MLDIDFLKANRTSFRNSIAYEYKTGIFKSEVCAKIDEIFEFRGFDCCEVDYSNFNLSSRSASLFSGVFFIKVDLNKLVIENEGYKKDFELLLGDIEKKEIKNKFFFLYKEDNIVSEIIKSKAYEHFIKDCSYIIEPDLFKSSINKVINFLIESNNQLLFDFDLLKNKDDFVKAMVQGVEIVDHSLLNFEILFTKSIIHCIDNNIFDMNIFNRMFVLGDKIDNFALYKALYDFMGSFSDRVAHRVFEVVVDLFFGRKYSTRLIIYSIMKIVREFSYINNNLGCSEEYLLSLNKSKRYALDKFKSVPINNLFRFSVNLSKWEKRLNTGNFLSEFYYFITSLVK